MKTVTSLLCALLLSGCATCRNHPVACSTAAAIVVSSAVTYYGEHRIERSLEAAQNQAQQQQQAFQRR